MGIRPRKSSSRGPGALLGRLALSGRDRLYRPRVACRGACPHAQAQWCRGACPHAQAQWCRGACPHAQTRTQALRLGTGRLYNLRTPKAFASRQAASTTNAKGSEGVVSRRLPLQRVQLTISHVGARVLTRRPGPKHCSCAQTASTP